MVPHSTWLLLGMAFVAGAFMPVQAGINGQLAKHITSPLAAATISFVVGSLALLLIVVLLRSPVAIEGFQKTQWWHWTGGLIGAFFVFGATYAAPKIGALLFMALVLIRQSNKTYSATEEAYANQQVAYLAECTLYVLLYCRINTGWPVIQRPDTGSPGLAGFSPVFTHYIQAAGND